MKVYLNNLFRKHEFRDVFCILIYQQVFFALGLVLRRQVTQSNSRSNPPSVPHTDSYTQHSLHCTMYNCAVYIVQCTNVHCTLYTVQNECTVYDMYTIHTVTPCHWALDPLELTEEFDTNRSCSSLLEVHAGPVFYKLNCSTK